jgi:hypothetical protein
LTTSRSCCTSRFIGVLIISSSPPVKRLKQQDLLVVNLEVISTPIKRLEQQDILMVKLEVKSTPIKRLKQQDLLVVKLEVKFLSFYWSVYHLQFDH